MGLSLWARCGWQSDSSLLDRHVNLPALRREFLGLLIHPALQRLGLAQALGCGEVPHFLRDLHAAELGAAHAAKVRALAAVFGQGFVVEVARGVGVQPQVELVFPAEFKAGLADRVVAGTG